MPFNILVIGAGELGTAVLKSLAAHDRRQSSSITTLVRSSSITQPSAAKKAEFTRLQVLGIKLLGGDIEAANEGELQHVFEKYDTVISCSGMAGSSGLQVKLARAAIAAKVSRYVPWQYGLDYDTIGRNSAQNLFNEQLDVRDLLRAQKTTQWLVFTVGVFMSFIFLSDFGMTDLDNGIVRAFGSWDNQFTTTTVHDIGRLVAETVFSGGDVWTSSANNVVFAAGDTLTYDKLASDLSKALRKPLKRELWTVDFMKQRLEADRDNGFKKYGVVWAEACGVAWKKDETFNAMHSMQMSTVEEWARQYAF